MHVGVGVGIVVRKPSAAVRSFPFLGFQNTRCKTAITGACVGKASRLFMSLVGRAVFRSKIESIKDFCFVHIQYENEISRRHLPFSFVHSKECSLPLLPLVLFFLLLKC